MKNYLQLKDALFLKKDIIAIQIETELVHHTIDRKWLAGSVFRVQSVNVICVNVRSDRHSVSEEKKVYYDSIEECRKDFLSAKDQMNE